MRGHNKHIQQLYRENQGCDVITGGSRNLLLTVSRGTPSQWQQAEFINNFGCDLAVAGKGYV